MYKELQTLPKTVGIIEASMTNDKKTHIEMEISVSWLYTNGIFIRVLRIRYSEKEMSIFKFCHINIPFKYRNFLIF